jgi:hypothetical protein
MYVEIDSVSKIRTTIDHLTEHYRSTDIQVTPPRSGSVGNVGIEVVIHPSTKNPFTPSGVAKDLETLDDVVFALESI